MFPPGIRFFNAEILKNGNVVFTCVSGFKILWIFLILPYSVFNWHTSGWRSVFMLNTKFFQRWLSNEVGYL